MHKAFYAGHSVSLPFQYKWIAMNYDGFINLFEEKPEFRAGMLDPEPGSEFGRNPEWVIGHKGGRCLFYGVAPQEYHHLAENSLVAIKDLMGGIKGEITKPLEKLETRFKEPEPTTREKTFMRPEHILMTMVFSTPDDSPCIHIGGIEDMQIWISLMELIDTYIHEQGIPGIPRLVLFPDLSGSIELELVDDDNRMLVSFDSPYTCP